MSALPTVLKSILVAGALVLASAQTGRAADGLPTFNIEPSCHAAADAAVTTSRDENACKADENTALTKLKDEWGQFNPSQRRHCVSLSSLGGAPSYVELLTCLELAKASAELPDDTLKEGGKMGR